MRASPCRVCRLAFARYPTHNPMQDVEKVPQRRSRIVQTLNVPQRVCLGPSLAAALLDELFEHPAGSCPVVPDMRTIEFSAGQHRSSAVYSRYRCKGREAWEPMGSFAGL